MGIFSFTTKKRIMPSEFDRLKNRLRSRGLSSENIEEVEAVAEASLRETGSYAGLDRREKDQLIETLRNHQNTNHLSDKDIEAVDKTLSEQL